MRASKLFLALMVVVALVCLSTVQGQYGTTSTYSSSASTAGSTSSATYQYGQSYPTPVGQTTSTYLAPTASQVPGYLRGTVLSIRDENSMYVNFTGSNVPGMEGVTLILLPRPVPVSTQLYFQGKELSFNLQGHDILGRPICDAYYNGIPIEDYSSYGYYSPRYGYYPPQGYYPPPYGYYSYMHEYYFPGSL